ncbi:MAG: hypothetical protein LAO79_15460 [Acidobacteriia bacterium]|nr:hypothetical protein [Terriglobia bacterium]
MKRKRTPDSAEPVSETVVPDSIVEQARRAIEAERVKKPALCVVCGGDCAPNSSEGLCWVCRRLKLSAWRDNDSQLSAQE